MQNTRPEAIQKTIALWQRRGTRTVDPDDAKQMLDNVCGFFGLLSKWKQQDQLGRDQTKQFKSSPMLNSRQ
jgi:hypothetical protein